MSILKDLPDLVRAGVITEETADRIRDYYQNKSGPSTNRLFIVFGVLGAILVGLGIILIIAHNWDELSRGTKTFFAFLPLLIGQLLCGYVLMKSRDSSAWRESAAAFLFFAIGASISLISQIYNIPGDIGTFMLTWMLLSLPLIYLMQSSITSLLYVVGITFYGVDQGYFSYSASGSLYWLLLLAVLPHYYHLYRGRPEGNFMIFHNWMVPVSIAICLGTVVDIRGRLLFIAYFSLFGLFYLVGNTDFFKRQKAISNGYRFLGSLGTIVMLLMLTFSWFWDELREEGILIEGILESPELYASVITSLLASIALYFHCKNKALGDLKPVSWIFVLFIPTFIIGISSPIAVVLINLYVFAVGILTIWDGARHDHLGILNYGLLIITALVICRFFDTDLTFVVRGIMFMSVGTGFFAANYWILKRRKANG
jgi:uncharacterized membrane protein